MNDINTARIELNGGDYIEIDTIKEGVLMLVRDDNHDQAIVILTNEKVLELCAELMSRVNKR